MRDIEGIAMKVVLTEGETASLVCTAPSVAGFEGLGSRTGFMIIWSQDAYIGWK